MEASRRARKKARTRRALYEAALELFRERGFDETRVDEITARADVGTGTFFNYFPTKSAVLTDYHGGMVEAAIVRAEGVEEGTARQRIVEQLRWAIRQAADEGDLFRILIRRFLMHPPLVARTEHRVRDLLAIYARWMAEGIERGELRPDVDPDRAAGAVNDLWNMATFRWADPRGIFAAPGEELVARVELLFQGLEAP